MTRSIDSKQITFYLILIAHKHQCIQARQPSFEREERPKRVGERKEQSPLSPLPTTTIQLCFISPLRISFRSFVCSQNLRNVELLGVFSFHYFKHRIFEQVSRLLRLDILQNIFCCCSSKLHYTYLKLFNYCFFNRKVRRKQLKRGKRRKSVIHIFVILKFEIKRKLSRYQKEKSLCPKIEFLC